MSVSEPTKIFCCLFERTLSLIIDTMISHLGDDVREDSISEAPFPGLALAKALSLRHIYFATQTVNLFWDQRNRQLSQAVLT